MHVHRTNTSPSRGGKPFYDIDYQLRARLFCVIMSKEKSSVFRAQFFGKQVLYLWFVYGERTPSPAENRNAHHCTLSETPGHLVEEGKSL